LRWNDGEISLPQRREARREKKGQNDQGELEPEEISSTHAVLLLNGGQKN